MKLIFTRPDLLVFKSGDIFDLPKKVSEAYIKRGSAKEYTGKEELKPQKVYQPDPVSMTHKNIDASIPLDPRPNIPELKDKKIKEAIGDVGPTNSNTV